MKIILVVLAALLVLGRKSSAVPFDPWTYDANHDGTIDIWETTQAANDAITGKITEAQRDQVAALWQSGATR